MRNPNIDTRGTVGGFAMFSLNFDFSLHFAYYGADVVEDTVHPFADGSFTTDVEIEKMIGPVGRTDLIGATVKGIGGYLRLVHRAEDFSSMPQHLDDLLRRAA
jgi:hypothetical protein